MQRAHRTKYILAFSFIALLLLLLLRQTAHASSSGFSLSPSVIAFRVEKTGELEKTFTLRNSGSHPISLGIVIRHFTTAEDGTIIYGDEKTVTEDQRNFITHNVQVLENSIPITSLTLSPGQTQDLKLSISIDRHQKISGETFSIFFMKLNENEEGIASGLKNESPLSAQVKVSYGTALHVLIADSASKKSFSVIKFTSPNFIQNGPVSFTAKIKNTSSNYINVYGNITIKNLFGQKIGIVRIPNNILLPGSSKELGGSTPMPLVWNSKFLIGPYKATLTVINEEGIERSVSISLFAFPVKNTLLVLFALLIGNFLLVEVKKRI